MSDTPTTEAAALATDTGLSVRESSGLSRSSIFHLNEALLELLMLREEMQEAGEDTAACEQQIVEYVQAEPIAADRLRGTMRHCEMMASAAKEEARRIQATADGWQARLNYLKERTKGLLEASGRKMLPVSTGEIRLKGNGGLAPLWISDESLVPEECCDWIGSIDGELMGRIKALFILAQWPATLLEMLEDLRRTPNNAKIRQALKAGDVAGCRLDERGQHIEVK